MTWTDDQREILASRGENLLVSASAGSGKTTIMIEKIASLLSEGVDINEIFVSTFTKAAAADIRAKLTARLKSEPKLRPQLKRIAAADITNLDSFCQRLIVKYFYAAGVDPDFEVVDENRRRGILSRQLDAVLSREAAAGDADFTELYDLLLTNRRDVRLRECVTALYDFAVCQPDPLAFLDSCVVGGREAELSACLAAARQDEKRRLLCEIDRTKAACAAAGYGRDGEMLDSLPGLLEGGTLPPASRAVVEPRFIELKKRCAALKEACRKFVEPLPSFALTAEHTAVLLRLTRRLYDEADRYKRRNSLVDFADLERYGREILLDPQAGGEIRARYKRVFVDEYQDINPLQEELIGLISGGRGLFMVGDVKQSIYAFRGCEPDIFLARARAYREKGGGRVVALNVNYRSGEKVIGFVNEVMDAAMTEERGGVNYRRDARLTAGAGFKGEPVEMYVFGKLKREPVRGLYDIGADIGPETDAEATAAARRIASLIGSAVNAAAGETTLRPRDIAVLVRSGGTHVAALARELKALRVPFVLSRRLKYASVPEIKGLLAYLAFIDNYCNETALAGAMLSYIGGFSEDELLEIKQPRLSFTDSVFTYDGAASAKLQAFLSAADRYRRLSLTATAGELAGTVVGESEYFKYVLAAGGDGEALDEFLEYIGAMPERGLHECLTQIEAEQPETETTAGGDAVRITTIHASKGLEFPAVVLYGAGRRPSAGSPAVLIDRRLKLALKLMDTLAAEESETDLYAAVKAARARRESEEELRLLYVALTRAKSFLAVFGSGEKGFMPYLLPFRQNYEASVVTAPPPRFVLPPPELGTLSHKLREAFFYRVPVSEAPQKSYVTKLAADAETDETRVYAAGEGDDRAARRGSAYHKAMELLDFEGDFEAQWNSLPAEVARLCDRTEIKRAFEVVGAMTSGKRVYKEKAFVMPVKASELGFDGGGRVLVQGVVDLLILDEGRGVIVDYKTGEPRNLNKPSYEYQLQFYRSAAETVLGVPITDAYIYSFAAGETFRFNRTISAKSRR